MTGDNQWIGFAACLLRLINVIAACLSKTVSVKKCLPQLPPPLVLFTRALVKRQKISGIRWMALFFSWQLHIYQVTEGPNSLRHSRKHLWQCVKLQPPPFTQTRKTLLRKKKKEKRHTCINSSLFAIDTQKWRASSLLPLAVWSLFFVFFFIYFFLPSFIFFSVQWELCFLWSLVNNCPL